MPPSRELLAPSFRKRGGVNRPRRVVQRRHISKHEAPGASSIWRIFGVAWVLLTGSELLSTPSWRSSEVTRLSALSSFSAVPSHVTGFLPERCMLVTYGASRKV